MLGDRCVRFHAAGILRELPWVAAALMLLARMRTRLMGALVRYLAQPVKHHSPAATADPRSLAAILDRGDVLLSDGNTRVAAMVKRITQSPWSHVDVRSASNCDTGCGSGELTGRREGLSLSHVWLASCRD
jgi:hypothetical protein